MSEPHEFPRGDGRAALARIDERTLNIQRDVNALQRDVKQLRDDVGADYVSREEFRNLKNNVALHQRILFSTIGLICMTVIGAILMLVVKHG